jgi:hypothetical protein
MIRDRETTWPEELGLQLQLVQQLEIVWLLPAFCQQECLNEWRIN